MKKWKHILTITAGLIIHLCFVTGCAVGPDYIKPQVLEPTEWLEKDHAYIKIEKTDDSQWWKAFNDPALETLIDLASQQNLNLQIAGIRIMEARAEMGVTFGNLFPQTQKVRGSYASTETSENAANTLNTDVTYRDVGVGFDTAWELDFWGKFRRAVEASQAGLNASIAAYDNILVALTAEVARVYVQIRTFEQRIHIAKENVRIQKRSFQIAKVRFESGEVTELDVSQAVALLKNTEALIPGLEAGLRRSKNALSILLGRTPSDFEEILKNTEQIPSPPPEIAVDMPADLLRRRPDVRLAEYQMMSQSALIGVAKADLFPHFTLFGSIGLRSTDGMFTKAGGMSGSDLGDIFESDSIAFSGGPSVSWNILNYGRITNHVRVQDARLQKRVVNYQITVLKAVQEVENGLVGFLKSRERKYLLKESVQAAKRSVEISTIQYQEGIVDYQRVLDAQRFFSSQQDLLAKTRGTVVLDLIALYKAMGGGWEIRKEKDFLPEATKAQMRNRTNWGNLLKQ